MGSDMRYCPICWSERRVRHGIAGMRYWWKHSVMKEPEPEMAETLMKVIPSLVSSIVALQTIEKVMRDMEEEFHGRTDGCSEAHKELR